jgi:hypothetical protein
LIHLGFDFMFRLQPIIEVLPADAIFDGGRVHARFKSTFTRRVIGICLFFVTLFFISLPLET